MHITPIHLPRHATRRYPARPLSGLRYVIYHHSATPHDTQDAEDWADWHVRGKDWPGIAYTFCILTDGTIQQTTDWTERGYHCKGRNTDSIGVCLQGDFTQHRPTAAQLESAAWLHTHINSHVGRHLEVAWHDHYRPTECPGRYFPRQLLLDLIAGYYAPDEPEPPVVEPPVTEPEDDPNDCDDCDDYQPPTAPPDPSAPVPTGCFPALLPFLFFLILLIL